MKNIIAACLAALSLAGCVNDTKTSEQIKQNAELFAQELETLKDPVQVMDAYITYFQQDMGLMFHEIADACQYRDTPYYTDKYDPQKCAIAEALAEPGTLYSCIDTENQSDECILYRRSRHETKIAYFDYKRFLGTNTRIKSDSDFLKLARIYSGTTKCENLEESTSIEKQACKERRQKALRLAVKQKVHCKKLVEIEYKEELDARYRAYQFEVGAWHYSHVAAMRDVEKVMRSFADEYMCDISGWETDMFK